MAQVNKNTLKEYFQTGSIPNQQNFSDLIDSFVNIQDDSSTVKTMYESNSNTNNFTDSEKNSLSDLNAGATLANDDTKFATQKQAKDAINELDADLQGQIDVINQAQSSGALGYETKALMDADLAPNEGALALVTNDSTASNNNWYRKVGASGTGSWTQRADFYATTLDPTDTSEAVTGEAVDKYKKSIDQTWFDISQMSNATHWTSTAKTAFSAIKSFELNVPSDKVSNDWYIELLTSENPALGSLNRNKIQIYNGTDAQRFVVVNYHTRESDIEIFKFDVTVSSVQITGYIEIDYSVLEDNFQLWENGRIYLNPNVLSVNSRRNWDSKDSSNEISLSSFLFKKAFFSESNVRNLNFTSTAKTALNAIANLEVFVNNAHTSDVFAISLLCSNNPPTLGSANYANKIQIVNETQSEQYVIVDRHDRNNSDIETFEFNVIGASGCILWGSITVDYSKLSDTFELWNNGKIYLSVNPPKNPILASFKKERLWLKKKNFGNSDFSSTAQKALNAIPAFELNVDSAHEDDDWFIELVGSINPPTLGSTNYRNKIQIYNGTEADRFVIVDRHDRETNYEYFSFNVGSSYEVTGHIAIDWSQLEDTFELWNNGRIYIKPNTKKDPVIQSYAYSKNGNSSQKKILWLGTSIPEGAEYPEVSAQSLGYDIYNKSVGSSGIVVTSFTPEPSVTSITGRVGKDLCETKAEKAARYTGLDSSEIAIIQGWSYEDLVIPYIDGTIDEVDAIVFDHGYNDRDDINNEVVAGLNSIDWGITSVLDSDRDTWSGAFRWLLNKIFSIKPEIKIIIGGFLEGNSTTSERYGDVLRQMHEEMSRVYSFPLLRVFDETGFNMEHVPNTSSFISNYNSSYGTSYNTWQGDGSGNVKFYQFYCPDSVHPHSDRTGESNKRLNKIYTKLLRDVI